MVIAIELNGTQFWEKSGEWFEIASTITPELYDTKFCYQFIVSMAKCEKTVKKRQSKSKENIREEKSLNQCFQSAHIRNLLDFDWLVSRHPRRKGIIQLHWRTVLLFFRDWNIVYLIACPFHIRPFARRTKLYSVLFPLCQKYIHWLLIKYVYEVVRSLPHWKELSESFRGYFNRKKFVVSCKSRWYIS